MLARSRERSANAARRWTCERKKGVFVSENAPLLSMAISRILYGPDNRGTVMIIYLSDIPEDSGLERFRDRRAGCPSSVLSCTAWGFSCLANYFASGELLPRLFTLACSSKNGRYLFCDTLRQHPACAGVARVFYAACRRVVFGLSSGESFNSPAIICHQSAIYHNQYRRKAADNAGLPKGRSPATRELSQTGIEVSWLAKSTKFKTEPAPPGKTLRSLQRR